MVLGVLKRAQSFRHYCETQNNVSETCTRKYGYVLTVEFLSVMTSISYGPGVIFADTYVKKRADILKTTDAYPRHVIGDWTNQMPRICVSRFQSTRHDGSETICLKHAYMYV